MAGEAADTADKLRQALRLADAFSAAYAAARQRSAQLCPRNPWRFSAAAVLAEFDPFLERLRELQHIALTALLFQRLERVEIGGSRVRPRAPACAATCTQGSRSNSGVRAGRARR